MAATRGANPRLKRTSLGRAEADPPPALARIHEVARKQFAERGYAATSMRDIAAEVGISISTLFFHCSSKEQLVFDVLETSLAELSDGLRARADAAGPAWDGSARDGSCATSRPAVGRTTPRAGHPHRGPARAAAVAWANALGRATPGANRWRRVRWAAIARSGRARRVRLAGDPRGRDD